MMSDKCKICGSRAVIGQYCEYHSYLIREDENRKSDIDIARDSIGRKAIITEDGYLSFEIDGEHRGMCPHSGKRCTVEYMLMGKIYTGDIIIIEHCSGVIEVDELIDNRK